MGVIVFLMAKFLQKEKKKFKKFKKKRKESFQSPKVRTKKRIKFTIFIFLVFIV